jgi:electron transfer flavoprotein alpha subunit
MGRSRVYVVDHPLLSHYRPDVYASALEALCRACTPATVLMGHTYDNLEVGPKLACKTGRELITDRVKVERDMTGSLLCTKPIYGGNAVVVLELDTKPQIATIRAKTMDAMEKGRVRGDVIPFPCPEDDRDRPRGLALSIGIGALNTGHHRQGDRSALKTAHARQVLMRENEERGER